MTLMANLRAGTSTSCPGLDPGPRRAALGKRDDETAARSSKPSRIWVPALRPGQEGGASAADHLADLAVSALIAEAELTPKPGLVDARGAGAHVDVELGHFLASAQALRPTFAALAAAAQGRAPSPALREELAAIGRVGEAAMFAATGGANTHRGAIFALGLLVAAAAMRPGASADEIREAAGAIARQPDRAAPPLDLNGARACRRYGVTGARGEAAAGFPHVGLALDVLRTRRAEGADETTARLDALLAVMTTLDDTCLLHRGGRLALRVARLGARAALAAGGAATPAGMAALKGLDRRLLALDASPGGAADMLAAALFLDAVTKRHPGRSEAESRDRLQEVAPSWSGSTGPSTSLPSSTSNMGPPVKPEDDGGVSSIEREA